MRDAERPPYVQLPPRPELRAHVACAWVERSRPDGTSFRDRVLPDAFVREGGS